MTTSRSKIVIATCGFDPIHSGHISYLAEARQLGDMLIVGVNSHEWLVRKKGNAFMPFEDRWAVIQNLGCVSEAIGFNDDDDTANSLIERVKNCYKDDIIIFANGGDRRRHSVPEQNKYGADPQVTFVFGVGGSQKEQSSSELLNAWNTCRTERNWGYYRVLHTDEGVKVKELTIDPGKDVSMQRHFLRSEHWFIAEGTCTVYFEKGAKILNKHEHYHVPTGKWHRITNQTNEPCKIIEIQYGEKCVEEDIERL